VGDWARELCGGTHTQRSSQVGLVKFLSEGSIGAGVRRVEALVGVDAYQFLAREHLLVSQSASLVSNLEGIMGLGETYGDARIWTFLAPEGIDAAALRDLVSRGRDKAHQSIPSVVVGASVGSDKVSFVVATNAKGREAGLSASTVLGAALAAVDGRGGGKDDLAQGGGTNVSGVAAAFDAARESVRVSVGA